MKRLKSKFGLTNKQRINYIKYALHRLSLEREQKRSLLFNLLKKILSGVWVKDKSYCWHKPTQGQIEITNRCNLDCLMCHRHSESYKKRFPRFYDMPFEKFEKIISQLDCIRFAWLYGVGEPLIHSDLAKMIKLCKERKIEWVGITTNGMLLNKERADAIIDAGLDELRVSLDSGDKEILRELRPPTDLDMVYENLRYFSKRFEGVLSLNAMINKENLDSLVGVVDIAIELGVKYVEMVETKTLNEEFAVSDVCFNGIDRDDKYKVLDEIKTKCKDNGIDCFVGTEYFTQCFDPFHRAYIDIDGNLTPCCTIPEISFGNVLEQGFDNLWNGKAIRQWRRKLIDSDPPKKCLEVCRIKSKFGDRAVEKERCTVAVT